MWLVLLQFIACKNSVKNWTNCHINKIKSFVRLVPLVRTIVNGLLIQQKFPQHLKISHESVVLKVKAFYNLPNFSVIINNHRIKVRLSFAVLLKILLVTKKTEKLPKWSERSLLPKFTIVSRAWRALADFCGRYCHCTAVLPAAIYLSINLSILFLSLLKLPFLIMTRLCSHTFNMPLARNVSVIIQCHNFESHWANYQQWSQTKTMLSKPIRKQY